MVSREPKTIEMSSVYDDSSMDDEVSHTTIPATSIPVEEEHEDYGAEDVEEIPPQLFSPWLKLDPQLLEKFYINLDRITETGIQETAERMHSMVNDIMELFETNRQETLEANLSICRALVKDIQQMEREQDVMKYQIELYTHKVRQAHDQVFKRNTARK